MAMPDDAVRSGTRAEIATIVWMAAEAALAIAAGVRARSVLVMAFGFDSVIEMVSGILLLLRLRQAVPEHRARRIAAFLLGALCVYVAASIAFGLVYRIHPEQSLLALVVTSGAVVAMPLLAMWKRRVNATLQSAALRTDIAETIACAWISAIVLGAIVLNRFVHAWWIEYLASGILLLWLIRETKEAFEERHEQDE
jgi:divalent metal cation (Fe/Co/Zn/Cd) transporter